MLFLLLETPTDDSVEVALAFVKEVGASLDDKCKAALMAIMDRFRAILQEGSVQKRTQYMIEGMFAIRKAGFESQGFIAVKPELDLVEEDDQITHEVRCVLMLRRICLLFFLSECFDDEQCFCFSRNIG